PRAAHMVQIDGCAASQESASAYMLGIEIESDLQGHDVRPVDPSTLPSAENEESAPWVVRKLVGSMTGRIVMASYESLRAAGTGVVCLSPWGDSSPLFLPCIRFRDLLVHSVIVVTGGTAALISPAMTPIADTIASSSFASSIAVEIIGTASHEAVVKGGDWLLVDKPIDILLPAHASTLQTSTVKTILITLKYKHIIDDAALGFFRSPVHRDTTLIADVAGYFAVEKGWFSPYLFATSRRPVIPRTMKADVIFAHGPFLTGDYEVAETLLAQSTIALHFCVPPPPKEKPTTTDSSLTDTLSSARNKLTATLTPDTKHSRSPSPSGQDRHVSTSARLEASYKKLSDRFFGHGDKAPPTPSETPVQGDTKLPDGVDETDINPLSASPPPPRRMLILLLGLKPHRGGLWTTSARPSESVMQYLLLSNCPTIVVPVKPGSPLVAWDTLTLAQLHKLRKEGKPGDNIANSGVVRIVFEFVALCVDWERVVVPEGGGEGEQEKKEKTVKDAIGVLVDCAMRSAESKEVEDKVDADRAGIAMFRIP
ncbi:hypothetical protein FRB99_007429, partial [Tulasnella sp. 403]